MRIEALRYVVLLVGLTCFGAFACAPRSGAQSEKRSPQEHEGENDWFAFAPKPDSFAPTSGFDLRSLNEKTAGDGGYIGVKDGRFVQSKTGRSVRFWAVNGPPESLKDRAALRRCARLLAKYGVNMVRIHGGYFDENGEVKPDAIQHAIDIVETMKAEGIYSHFSIYFPLWLTPKADSPFLAGYDGQKKPFAALYFNADFQQKYQSWWRALLLTPGARSGKRLLDDPAVAGVEIINEDSYFFWTFSDQNIPDPQLRLLEKRFGDWLKKKYGSLPAAFAKWNDLRVARDNPEAGRIGFRPLWNMFNEKTPRDRDTARFLLESQRGFYQETSAFLRGMGFRGLITCSNWATASPEVFGPLEKYSYAVGDFIDRHGYFSCLSKGEFSEWSLRDGHTYADRSALRFDPEEPGKPKQFVHPVIDPHYNDKPSMISETTFTRPNRYRSEAPLLYAAYGALQQSDAIVHFAYDGADWAVKPNYFMQPWTLMSPAMMGQFPATAALYRLGLVAPGEILADVNLKIGDTLDLKGTPLPQDAAFDELRLKDVPQGDAPLRANNVIDPLIHFAGQTRVRFTETGGASKVANLSRFVDRKRQTVTSATGELTLDYGKGTLLINAPQAQGISGAVSQLGEVALKDLTLSSSLELGHLLAVSLDGKPLAISEKILLQVMSEEKNSGFTTEPAGKGIKRITHIGKDPWMVRRLAGTVRLKRADADQLKVTALDFNGYPTANLGGAAKITLRPTTLYYLITK